MGTKFTKLALAMTVALFAGCADGDNNTIRIGVLAPLDAGLTQFGHGIRNSVQLAVDEANEANLIPGWRIELVAVDDSSDPQIGSVNAARLVDDPSVIGVVGTYNSGVAGAVLPAFESADLTLISPGNTNPTLTLGPDRDNPLRPYDNYFRMVAHDGQQGAFLAGVARELGIDTVAVVTDEKPVSQGLANDFRDAFVAAGGTLLSFEVVPEGETDYAPFSERAADENPDLLFFGGEYDHAVLLKQDAVEAGLTVPLMGGDGIQADQYIALAGDISEGDLASSVGRPVELEPEGTEFLAAYDASGFAEPPSTFGPYAYDAANILISAAASVLGGREHFDRDTRADIVAAVQDVTNADLVSDTGAVTGEIGFDEFGDTVNPVLTSYRVEDGAWVAFEP